MSIMAAHENVVATQFHPEKSSAPGLALLANFLPSGRQQPRSRRMSGPGRSHLTLVTAARVEDDNRAVATQGGNVKIRKTEEEWKEPVRSGDRALHGVWGLGRIEHESFHYRHRQKAGRHSW